MSTISGIPRRWRQRRNLRPAATENPTTATSISDAWNGGPRWSGEVDAEHGVFGGRLSSSEERARDKFLIATVNSAKLQLNALAAAFASLSAQSSDAIASLALASCDGAVSRLNALMDDLLRISEGKAVDSKTQEKLEVTHAGATNVAAEREAFVSASESGSDSESDLFSESDRESDSASSVNFDCDSDSDVDSGSGSQKEPLSDSECLEERIHCWLR